MSTDQRIAFVGLGQMGRPMAACLLRAGFDVVGHDAFADAVAGFVAAGGRGAASAAEVVEGASVIVTVLPNGAIVRDVLRSAAASLRPGALLIEMSSAAPFDTRALASEFSSLRIVDAPVSGGVKRAIEGALTVMTGGKEADKAEAGPILQALARQVFDCGPLGAGHAMKAINNFVSGAGTMAAAEAVRLGAAFGLDPERMVDVLNASSGKNNATEVKLRQFMLSGSFASGFALGLMAKDIRTAADLAGRLKMDLPGLRHVAALWEDAAARLGGAVDHTHYYDYAGKVGLTGE